MTKAAHGGTPIYCSQELKFKAPVHIGDTITCTAELIEKIPEKSSSDLPHRRYQSGRRSRYRR